METPATDMVPGRVAARAPAAVDLYWLPLGAGGHFVRLNRPHLQALAARLQRRPRCDLYHSALQIEAGGSGYVIEQTPVPDLSGSERGWSLRALSAALGRAMADLPLRDPALAQLGFEQARTARLVAHHRN